MDHWGAKHLRLVVFVLLAFPGAPLLAADSAVVLMYHRFGEDRYPSTSIRIDQFEAQLQYLKEQHYAVVPLATVLGAMNSGSEMHTTRYTTWLIRDSGNTAFHSRYS